MGRLVRPITVKCCLQLAFVSRKGAPVGEDLVFYLCFCYNAPRLHAWLATNSWTLQKMCYSAPWGSHFTVGRRIRCNTGAHEAWCWWSSQRMRQSNALLTENTPVKALAESSGCCCCDRQVGTTCYTTRSHTPSPYTLHTPSLHTAHTRKQLPIQYYDVKDCSYV